MKSDNSETVYACKPGYKERCEQQLADWVQGNSIHNTVDDECCPDFSCCRPELLAEQSIREAFARSNSEQRYQFLGVFLGSAIRQASVETQSSTPPSVHIICGTTPETTS